MILGVVVLVVVAGPLLLAPALFAGGIVGPLAFLVVVGLATAWLVTGRRPERDAGAIVRATLLGLGVLVLVSALAVIAFWASGVGGETVVAALVIAAGGAVLVAAFVRPARWLILPALAVAVPAAFVAAAGIDLDGGVGERSYRPASASQLEARYELGIGRLELDLRGADLPAGDRRLDLDVGMGEAVLIVPDDVCVATDATIGMGQADVFQRGSGGIDVAWLDQPRADAGATRLIVDADIGLGHLDVRKTDPRASWQGPGDRDRDGWDFDPSDEDRGENTACAA